MSLDPELIRVWDLEILTHCQTGIVCTSAAPAPAKAPAGCEHSTWCEMVPALLRQAGGMAKLSPTSAKGVVMGWRPAEGHRVPVSPAWELLENHELETAGGPGHARGSLGATDDFFFFPVGWDFFGGCFLFPFFPPRSPAKLQQLVCVTGACAGTRLAGARWLRCLRELQETQPVPAHIPGIYRYRCFSSSRVQA